MLFTNFTFIFFQSVLLFGYIVQKFRILVQVLPITGFLINKFLKQNVFFFICTIYFKRIFQSILFFRIFPVHTLIWIHTAISFSGFSRSILLFGSIQLLGTLEQKGQFAVSIQQNYYEIKQVAFSNQNSHLAISIQQKQASVAPRPA